MHKPRDKMNPMTRIDFNRYASSGYPPWAPRNSSGSAASEPDSQPSLLTRVADVCARLGRAGQPLPDTLRIEGVAVMRHGGLLAWAADLGWREGMAVVAMKAEAAGAGAAA